MTTDTNLKQPLFFDVLSCPACEYYLKQNRDHISLQFKPDDATSVCPNTGRTIAFGPAGIMVRISDNDRT